MRIINLVENEPGSSGCEAAHGLSFYIETANHKILFDTSPSEVVLRNAQKLGVDLTAVDTVILHSHDCRAGGILPQRYSLGMDMLQGCSPDRKSVV